MEGGREMSKTEMQWASLSINYAWFLVIQDMQPQKMICNIPRS